MTGSKIDIGLVFSFRNPEQWRRGFPDVYRDELDLIVAAERLGFDTIWLTEHHFADDGYSPSLVTLAAAIAGRTERIRIGFNLIVLPLHDPLNLAEDIATLDNLSNGRIDVGVGMGATQHEFDTFGIPMTERLQRFREGLDVLTGLLSRDTFSYQGKHYTVNNARLRPPSVQQPMPPLWIGATAPPALKRAGKRGAHLLGMGSAELQSIYEQARTEAGYDVATSKTMAMQWLHVADSDDQAWREAAPHFHYVLSGYKEWAAPGTPLYEVEIPVVADLQRMSKYIPFTHAFGSPETVLAKLRKSMQAVRTTHFALNTLAGMDPTLTRRSITAFAEEVAPELRADS